METLHRVLNGINSIKAGIVLPHNNIVPYNIVVSKFNFRCDVIKWSILPVKII